MPRACGARSSSATLRADHSAELGGIGVPTLVAWGDRDEFATRERPGRAPGAAIPDARLDVYPDGGHAFHWEDPAAFAGDLTRFVENHRHTREEP